MSPQNSTNTVTITITCPSDKTVELRTLMAQMTDMVGSENIRVHEPTTPRGNTIRSRKAAQTMEKIKELIGDMINKPGFVRPGDAWKICRPAGYSYTLTQTAFRHIMMDMSAQGRSRYAARGLWEILPIGFNVSAAAS